MKRIRRTKFFPQRNEREPGGSLAGLGAGFLGKVSPRHRVGAGSLLATHWAREAIVSTLVSDVATAYFQLRVARPAARHLAGRTLAFREGSLQLTQTLANGGATSMLDVRPAEQLVFTAAESIPDLERQIEQQENFLSTLLGNNPGPIARGMTLTEQPRVPEVPAGLPQVLLERRPDIREAEAQLIAANAQMGVAKSAYFPQINLTASAGYQRLSAYQPVYGTSWVCGVSEYPWYNPFSPVEGFVSNVRFTEARQQ